MHRGLFVSNSPEALFPKVRNIRCSDTTSAFQKAGQTGHKNFSMSRPLAPRTSHKKHEKAHEGKARKPPPFTIP